MELLAIVEAERQADMLLEDARERKERMVKEALDERKLLLASITPPPISEPDLKPLKPDLAALRERAARNRSKVVKMILEGL